MARVGGSWAASVGDIEPAACGYAADIEGAARGYADVVEAACGAGGIEGALVDTAARGSAGSNVNMSAVGVEAGANDPAGIKNRVGPMGTRTGLVELSRNSKSARVGVRL